MFDILLGQKFSNKCKHSVKCIRCRIETIRKKKLAMVMYLKKDVADLIATGHDAIAFGRIDTLIVEINHASCYEMIELYCKCILEHLSAMCKERGCPKEALQAAATLIFAAARFSDLPELGDLRRVFTERYGTHMESFINKEFVEKMQKKPFSKDMKLRLMEDIAQEFSVNCSIDIFENKMSNMSGSTYDQHKKHAPDTKENEKRFHMLDGRREGANVSSESCRKPAVNGAKNQDAQCNAHYEATSKTFKQKPRLRHDDLDVEVIRKEKGKTSQGLRYEPRARCSVQKPQVQVDFQSIPANGNIYPQVNSDKIKEVTAYESENIEAQSSIKKSHVEIKDNQNENHRNQLICEGNTHDKSERDVKATLKAVNMIPPYTKLTEGFRGTNADNDGFTLTKTSGDVKELDHNGQHRRPNRPVNAVSCRTIHSKPLHMKLKFKATSSNTDHMYPTDYEISTGGQGHDHLKDGLVNHERPKDNSSGAANPVCQTPAKHRKELVRNNGIYGCVVNQQSIIPKQSLSNHRSRRAVEDTKDDYDKEGEILDNLLMHYSKKGSNNDPRKGRTRTRPSADAAIVAEHCLSNASVPMPTRAASLPTKPIGAAEKAVKRQTDAASWQPDLLNPSSGAGIMHPRLPDFDSLAARIAALRSS